MIIINNSTTNTIYLTLSELQTAPSNFYRLTLTNRATKETVSMDIENISTQINFQKFEIDGTDLADYNTGLYGYEVVALNGSMNPVGNVLEYGYVDLRNGSTFSPVGYSDQNNLFKVYNG